MHIRSELLSYIESHNQCDYYFVFLVSISKDMIHTRKSHIESESEYGEI